MSEDKPSAHVAPVLQTGALCPFLPDTALCTHAEGRGERNEKHRPIMMIRMIVMTIVMMMQNCWLCHHILFFSFDELRLNKLAFSSRLSVLSTSKSICSPRSNTFSEDACARKIGGCQRAAEILHDLNAGHNCTLPTTACWTYCAAIAL